MNPHESLDPSAWVVRWAHLLPAGARVLDLAAGRGRHARLFAERGCTVVAADRDEEALQSMAAFPGITLRLIDLEGAPWAFDSRAFDGVIVTNYLYRPRLALLGDVLRVGGVLIYETFMIGNEAHGRPRSPEFLLRESELLESFGDVLTPVAFEQGMVSHPKPAVIQRYVGVRGGAPAAIALTS